MQKESELKPVYVVKGPNGMLMTNIMEISEDWAWIAYLGLKKLPSQLTAKHRQMIEEEKANGVQVLPIHLVDLES
jgi:hypothetical protein